MKSLRTFLFVVATALFSASAEEFREFTNQSGQKLKAAVVSASETDVTLKRENGAEVRGGLSFFSEADRAYIAEWRKAHPVELAYDFNIEATRQRSDRTKATERNLIVVYETWKFNIKIENRSKSGTAGSAAEGLQLVYNLSVTPKSRARQARALQEGLVPAGALLVRAASADLGKIDYLKSIEIESESIPVNHSELAPGWYYADGTKDELNDVLEGITVKLLKDGKVVAEKSFGSREAAGLKWIEPGTRARRR